MFKETSGWNFRISQHPRIAFFMQSKSSGYHRIDGGWYNDGDRRHSCWLLSQPDCSIGFSKTRPWLHCIFSLPNGCCDVIHKSSLVHKWHKFIETNRQIVVRVHLFNVGYWVKSLISIPFFVNSVRRHRRSSSVIKTKRVPQHAITAFENSYHNFTQLGSFHWTEIYIKPEKV